MTYEALMEAINRLIIKRQNTNCSDIEELNRINTMLNKLYTIKWTMLEQMGGTR